MSNPLKDSVKHAAFLAPFSVLTSAAQIISSVNAPDGVLKGVLIKAPGPTDDTPNTLSVFIGGANVTADQATTGGFPLAPGESITLPIELVDGIYAIATGANQKLNCILV
jgi:hypothetical protein